MNFYLFASNRYYPKGGADDFIGIYAEISDSLILAAVVDQLRREKLEKDERLRVNGFFHEENSMGVIHRWVFRMAEHLDDEKLRFCSVKETFDDLGPCGLIPLAEETIQYTQAMHETWVYAKLDPEKLLVHF